MKQMQVTTDGIRISGTFHAADLPLTGSPLIVAVHGGTYTSEYYRIAASPAGSFVDTATRNGCAVLTVDRPCYGGSEPVPDERLEYACQASLLNGAIAEFLALLGPTPVALVGHSIGGMICVEMAALGPLWSLTSLSLSGMGARLRHDGLAHRLADAGGKSVVDLPASARETAMLGPAGTYTESARISAVAAYAPAPGFELEQAPKWAPERLPLLAGQVSVPIHHAVAQSDALWHCTDTALAEFAAFFGPNQVRSERVDDAGHSIDHHIAAAWFHLRQCAFILECGLNRAV